MSDDDAWGRALLDEYQGREVAGLELENADGVVGPALPPAWFFLPREQWDPVERAFLDAIPAGPVLDLGAGAGRAALWFQSRGWEVTAVESSPGAAEVCRRRGVKDVRETDLLDPPDDKAWGAVLLLCGNLGLGGTFEGCRTLLTRLAEVCHPSAVLVGDTVDFGDPEQRLRLRYRDLVGPWWPQYNIPVTEMGKLVEGTGWRIERHEGGEPDHIVLLSRA